MHEYIYIYSCIIQLLLSGGSTQTIIVLLLIISYIYMKVTIVLIAKQDHVQDNSSKRNCLMIRIQQ